MQTGKCEIRRSEPDETETIVDLYKTAFPEEDLTSLVEELAISDKTISLVAVLDGQLCGNIIFSFCNLTPQTNFSSALLGPLAIAPSFQKQGFGTQLVRSGLKIMKSSGVEKVLVLGDPNYYSRHGFVREDNIIAPYKLPEEWADAWQSIALGKTDHSEKHTLVVPQPWRNAIYWS